MSVEFIYIFSVFFLIVLLFPISKEFFFYSLVSLIVFQNFFSVVFLQYLSDSSVKAWSGLKDIIVFFVFILSLIEFKGNLLRNSFDKFFFITLLIFTILTFTSSQDKIDAIKSARPYVFPPMIYFIGRRINLNYRSKRRAYFLLLTTFFLLIIIGVFEKLIGPHNFWTFLNYDSYVLSKYGLDIKGTIFFNNQASFPFGLGYYLRPMSLFAESVGLAFFLTSILFSLYSIKQDRPLFLIMIFSVSFIYVRGSLLLIALCFLITEIFFSEKELSFWKRLLLYSSVFLIIGFAIMIVIIDPYFLSSHFVSLVEGINIFKDNIFGLGLGSANWMNSFSEKEMEIESIDSFFATTLVELGFFGVLFYLFNMVFLVRMAKNSDLLIGKEKVMVAYIFSSFLISVLTASSFSFHNVFFIYLFLGIFISNGEKKNSISINELPLPS